MDNNSINPMALTGTMPRAQYGRITASASLTLLQTFRDRTHLTAWCQDCMYAIDWCQPSKVADNKLRLGPHIFLFCTLQ